MVSSVKVLGVPPGNQADINGLTVVEIGSQIFNTDKGMINFTPDGITFQNLVNSSVRVLDTDINFDLSYQGSIFLPLFGDGYI